MLFEELPLAGAYVIELDRKPDNRGFFARTFAPDEFEKRGLHTSYAQHSMAYNRAKGTIRGMHLQMPPFAEAKLLRCTRGGVFDVIVDLREGSPTYLQHASVELTADNGRALYVPEMFAHGYQTFEDHTDVHYQISAPYSPEHARGLRFDDPALKIDWPIEVTEISPKDRGWGLIGGEGGPDFLPS